MRKKLLFSLLLLMPALVALAQDRVVTGRVTSSDDGMALPGVNVLVQGTTRGTTTDAEGNFSLPLEPTDKSLILSFVGYQTATVEVGNQTTINVVLNSDITSLQEVVVIGYGVAKKSDLTGSVASVKGADLTRVPAATAAEALQGRIAGVQVTSNGEPGKAPNIRVRGTVSVSSAVEPLYVVDGVLTNDISFLGANDIESVNVLKDASASAIYGIRASSGVVIITTKRGTKEEPRIAYNGYAGFQKAINQVEMANGSEYIQLLNEKDAIAASRSNSAFTPRDPAAYPNSTNWYDQILRSNAYIQSHDISVSGGTDKTQYSLGGSYFYQQGLAKKTNYERINIRSNLETQATKYLKLGMTANIASYGSDNTPGSLFNSAYIAPSAIPVKINETTYASPQAFGDFANPAATQEYYNNRTKGIRLVGGLFADVKLAPNLTFKTYYGIDGKYEQNRNYVPRYFVSTAQRDTTRSLTKRIDNAYNYYWDNTLTYNFAVNDLHKFTVLVGANAQQRSSNYLSATRLGVEDYGQGSWYLSLGNADGQTNTDGGDKIRAFSYFGRVLYNYNERYMLTATVRRDATSNFPSNNRSETFSSFGLGWVLSNEDFMANQNIFQYLKLRAGWGQMGNDRIPAQVYQRTATTGGNSSVIFGTDVQTGASISVFVPENLQWEFTTETDIAIEGAVLKNKLSFELDYYHRKTSNAVFEVTVNSVFGSSNSSYLDNNADIINRGFEGNITWKDQVGNVRYSIGGVMAFNHNEVSSLKPGTIGIYGGRINVTPTNYTVVGNSIGEFYGRQVIGIFQNADEVANYKDKNGAVIQPDAKPGDFKYQDVNGDGAINDKDRVFLGSAIPKYNFGISLSAEYKGFDIALDLYAQGGNKIYNAKRYRQLGNENYDKDFYDNRWRGEGTSNSYPSADLSYNANKEANSWYVESGNFFKVRNIQLGYTIPKKATERLGVSRVRVYANASNPLVFFKYNGFTPEIPTSDPLSQNIDRNTYPMAATYNFGVNINL